MGLAFGLILTTAIRGASAATDEDRKTVAALDTEYQAAVKRNHATTMARILADDFVLVTGSGKTYTKADMIEDARSGGHLPTER
jgi:ketosteroid isomerase-like protein